MHSQTHQARGLPAPLYALLHLPGGLISGFVNVTLGFVLSRHGVSVAAVSGLVGLYLAPTTWSFVAGPVIDASLTPRLWYAMMVAVVVAGFIGFAVTPMTAAALPVLGALCLGVSIGGVCAGSAVTAAMVRP